MKPKKTKKTAVGTVAALASLFAVAAGPQAYATSSEQLYSHDAGAATVTVTPSDALASPAVVMVSGSGWVSNANGGSQLQIVECAVDPTNPPPPNIQPALCEANPRAAALADGTGSFGPIPVAVERTFVAQGSITVQCGQSAVVPTGAVLANCMLYVLNASSSTGSSAGHHLTFASACAVIAQADANLKIGTVSTVVHVQACV